MNDVQETSPDEARYWLALANGGGVMLQERCVTAPSAPHYRRHRQPKRLEAPSAVPQDEHF